MKLILKRGAYLAALFLALQAVSHAAVVYDIDVVTDGVVDVKSAVVLGFAAIVPSAMALFVLKFGANWLISMFSRLGKKG